MRHSNPSVLREKDKITTEDKRVMCDTSFEYIVCCVMIESVVNILVWVLW